MTNDAIVTTNDLSCDWALGQDNVGLNPEYKSTIKQLTKHKNYQILSIYLINFLFFYYYYLLRNNLKFLTMQIKKFIFFE